MFSEPAKRGTLYILLWTYCISDLLFDLHYLMRIIVINVPTELLMSSIVLTLSNYSGLFAALPLAALDSHLLCSSAHPEQGN